MPQKKRVLCVGTCTLNIVHVCEEYPIEEMRTRLADGYWQRGGGASNNCTVLSHLGTECEFFGVLSRAPAFSFLIDDFAKRGIHIENCPTVDIYQPYSSILSCRPTGTFTIIHTDVGFPILRSCQFMEKIKLNNYTWIHFEGRNPWETKPMIIAIRRYNTELNTDGSSDLKPITISVELSKSNSDLLQLAIRADIVFADREFATKFGWKTAKQTVYSLREHLTYLQLKEDKEDNELDICFRTPHVICLWSTEGVALLTVDYDYYYIPTTTTEKVIDALGSGDALIAGVIHSIITKNKGIKDAVEFGHTLAVFKMQHRGMECMNDFTPE